MSTDTAAVIDHFSGHDDSQVDIHTLVEHRNDHLSELDEATSEIPAMVNSVPVMLYTYVEPAEHVWWFDLNHLSQRQGIMTNTPRMQLSEKYSISVIWVVV